MSTRTRSIPQHARAYTQVYETEWGMLPHPAAALLGGVVLLAAAAVSLLLRAPN